MYLGLASTTGVTGILADTSGITYNPSTNTLGGTYTSTGTHRGTFEVNSINTAGTYYPVFAASAGDTTLYADSDATFNYNPGGNRLSVGAVSATSFTGSFTGSLTGSLFGTASFATSASQAITASRAISASFASTASYVNPLNQAVIITGSLTVSGSTGTVFSSNVDTLVLTGSLLISGSANINGPVTIGISNITTSTITSSAAGANIVFNQATGSYTAAKYLYTCTSASNARTGEVIAVWNGATTQFTDFSTLDIGSTTAVTASVSIVTAQAQFNVQTTNSGWRIKSQVTYL
jgi:hypothetical protein